MIADKMEEIRRGISLLTPIIEVRTEVTQSLALQLGFDCLCALGGGLSPTLIELAQQSDKLAFHTDYSKDVLTHLGAFMESELLTGKPDNLSLHQVDILDKYQMKELARMLRGKKVLFYTEGVLQYFDLTAKGLFLDIWKEISYALPGSIFITQDLRSKKDVRSILSLDETALLVTELVAGMTGVRIVDNSYDSHQDIREEISRHQLAFQDYYPFNILGFKINSLASLRLPGIDAERTIERLKDRRIYAIRSARF